jgi:hypothetical protein
MPLDVTTRGMVEEWIEFCISEKMLAGYVEKAKDLHRKGFMDSIPSFVYGIIYQSTQDTFFTWIRKYNREPTRSEVVEFMRIFSERSYVIKSRISQATNL